MLCRLLTCCHTINSVVLLLGPSTHLGDFLPIESHLILATRLHIQLMQLTLILLLVSCSSMRSSFLQQIHNNQKLIFYHPNNSPSQHHCNCQLLGAHLVETITISLEFLLNILGFNEQHPYVHFLVHAYICSLRQLHMQYLVLYDIGTTAFPPAFDISPCL